MTADPPPPPPPRDPDADELAAEYAGHVRSCLAVGVPPLTPEEFRLVWQTEDFPVPPSERGRDEE